jgi:hypothetical protein
LSLGGGWVLDRENPWLLAFDLTLARLSYGIVQATDPEGHSLGEFYSSEDYMTLTAGFNTTVSDGVELAIGLGYKRLALDYGAVAFSSGTDLRESTANMFDAGAVMTWSAEAGDWSVRPAAGVALVNYGDEIDFGGGFSDPLPTWFNYGVSVQVDAPTVTLGSTDVPSVSATLNVDGKHGLNEQRPLWGVGAEFAAMQMIFIRWGQRMDDRYHESQTTWGAALGLPAGAVRLRLEYSNFTGLGPWSIVNIDKFGFTFVWLFGGGASNPVEGTMSND